MLAPIACKLVVPDLALIEATLRESSMVKDVRKVMQRSLDERPIVAYVALNSNSRAVKEAPFLIAPQDLWRHCDEQLHGYEVPSAIVPVPAGDLLREELPVPLQGHHRLRNYIAPRNEIESGLQQLWQSALSLSEREGRFSVKSDFFELGGTSLKAGKLVAQMRRQFQVSLAVRDLFTHRSISAMANRIRELKEEARNKQQLHSPAHSTGNSNWDRSTDASSTDECLLPRRSHRNEYACHTCIVPTVPAQSPTALRVLFWQLLPLLVLQPMRCICPWIAWARLFVYMQSWTMNVMWLSTCPRFSGFVLALLVIRILESVLLPLTAVCCKWAVVGRYREGRYELWGEEYLRWWLANQIVELCGLGVFGSEPFLLRWYYRLCGASIGRGAVIDKSARVREFDLVKIGDFAYLDQCYCSAFALDRGAMVLRKVAVCHSATVCCKTAVAPGHVVPPGVTVGPLSSSYELGVASEDNQFLCRSRFRRPTLGLRLLVGYPLLFVLWLLSMTPWFLLLSVMIDEAKTEGWYERMTDLHAIIVWFTIRERVMYYICLRVMRNTIVPVLNLAICILVKRILLGKFTPGQWSKSEISIFRRWFMNNMICLKSLCGAADLVGRHYEAISIIYRLLGANIGRRVYWPGSGIDIVEIDLLEVGDDVVFGSRSVILPADALEAKVVSIEAGAMVADRCVLLPDVVLGRNAVLGSGSLARKGGRYEAGSVFVGSRHGDAVRLESFGSDAAGRNPFSLSDSTLKPFGKAFYKKEAPYFVLPLSFHVCFSTASCAVAAAFHTLPLVSALLLLHPCLHLVDTDKTYSFWELTSWLLLFFTGTHLVFAFCALLVDVLAKWAILGQRRPGAFSWDKSSYCQRWQLHLAVQRLRQNMVSGGRGVLDFLEGSAYLVWYFRALGASIGRDVCLYPTGAAPMMTEPDLVSIGDGACIDDASLVAHTNTLGEFELNHLRVGACTTLRNFSRLLAGAEMEERAMLLEHTLVLAGDIVERGRAWQGWPSDTTWGIEEDICQKGVDLSHIEMTALWPPTAMAPYFQPGDEAEAAVPLIMLENLVQPRGRSCPSPPPEVADLAG